MKKLIAYIGLLGLITAFMSISDMSRVYGLPAEKEIQIWCSPDLSQVTEDMVSAYMRIHPEARINLVDVNKNNYSEMIHDPDAIGLMKSEYFSPYKSEQVWRMVIGRDIFVAVMNPENPLAEEIKNKGLSARELRAIYTGEEHKSDSDEKTSWALNCWCLDADSSICCLAKFIGTDPESIKSAKAESAEEFINSICDDKYAIGFCKLTKIIDSSTQLIDNRLVFVPIDLNDNDNIDHFENIYTSTANLERGVWIGKYPRLLYSNILAVSGAKPTSPQEKAFLDWLSTEGQQYLNENGYSGLILSERKSNLEEIYADQVNIAGIEEKPSGIVNALLFAGLAIITIFLIFLIVRFFSYARKKEEVPTSGISSMFGETSVKIPEGLFFDRTHTWTFMEKNGKVRTGIDDFLQHVTGTITRVIMKNPGESVVKGEVYLTLVQDGKQLEIQSPVSGTIVEKNSDLLSDASLLNKSPYAEGWIYTVQTRNWMSELSSFFMGDSYRNWLKQEFSRLKDFLAFTVKPHDSEHVQVAMQDGGELKEGLLELFGPEVWEEFQTNFINNSK